MGYQPRKTPAVPARPLFERTPRPQFSPVISPPAAAEAVPPVIPIFVGSTPPLSPTATPRMGFLPFVPFQEAPAAANPLISFIMAGTTPVAPGAFVTPTFTRVFFQEAAPAPANPLIPFITVPVLWWSDPIKRSAAWSPASAPFYFKLIAQNVAAISYQDYEAILQFDSTQYTPAATVLFEVVMKTDTGTAYARLFNITDGGAVTGSDLSTTNTTFTRLESGALTLTGTKEYKAQAGTAGGNTTTFRGARLTVQQ